MSLRLRWGNRVWTLAAAFTTTTQAALAAYVPQEAAAAAASEEASPELGLLAEALMLMFTEPPGPHTAFCLLLCRPTGCTD